MSQNKKEILNFNEVRELLGVSKSTLYKLTSANKIPYLKPTNGKLFFKREEILLWLNQGDTHQEQETICNSKKTVTDGE